MFAKRHGVLAASLAVFACLGAVFGWSAFVPALRSAHGLSALQTQVLFSLTVASFTVTTVIAGRWMGRYGPRRVTVLGGVLFGAGYLTAGASGGRFELMALGVGFLSGAGIGLAYICPLTLCIQWFPERKGLAAGVTVASFGGGAIVLSAWVEALLGRGWPVLEVFQWVGGIYGTIVALGGFLMFRPPAVAGAAAQPQPGLAELWRDPAFRTLAAGIFSGTFAGLLIIGSLKPIGLAAGLPVRAAVLSISGFAAGNAAGRIGWGWLSDRLGYRAIPLSLVWMGLSVLALTAGRGTAPVFLGASFLAGAGFGACFVLYAAQVARRYGAGLVGRVYPVVFLAYGVAALTGPTLGGWLFDRTGSYTPPLLLGAAVVWAGAWRAWAGRAAHLAH